MLNETVLLMGRFLQINMLKCIERLSINQKSDKMIIDDNEMKGSVPIENIKKTFTNSTRRYLEFRSPLRN